MEYRSEKIDEIVGMLIKAQPELSNIIPDKTNNRGGEYIGRDNMVSSANKILAEYEGRVIPVNRHKDGAGLIMGIMLVHKPSHQYLISDYTIDEHVDFSSGDANWKKGGAITYGMRYTIGSMLGITFGDDDYKPEDDKSENKTNSGGYATPKQVAMLNARVAGYPDIKQKIFERLEITDMANVPFSKVTKIVDWISEETKSKK